MSAFIQVIDQAFHKLRCMPDSYFYNWTYFANIPASAGWDSAAFAGSNPTVKYNWVTVYVDSSDTDCTIEFWDTVTAGYITMYAIQGGLTWSAPISQGARFRVVGVNFNIGLENRP